MSIANAESRGYLKIKGAVDAFNFDFRHKTVLDIGSSTGGFTRLALEHGAAKVIAVEKGTNQMQSPLRFSPQVELHEKTDIFDFSLGPGQQVDIIVADVSFISLTKILQYAKNHLVSKGTDFLVMFKPQFEATSPKDLYKGVVKNDSIRRQIIKNFEFWLKNSGFFVVKKRDNDIKGRTGNQERFYWLRLV